MGHACGSRLRDRITSSIKLQPDGKLVAAGSARHGSFSAIAVARFDGPVQELSFGNNGMATTWLDSAYTVADALALQPDGKIVVSGSYKKGTVGDFILVRYKQDGSADSSFGVNGIVRTDISSGSFDAAKAIAIQTDGKILAAGMSGSSLALCRYPVDGSLDSSFDSDGKLTVPVPAGSTCMKLQTDGKIVAGSGNAVVRLMADGSVDNSFGVSGVTTLTRNFYGMAIQNDGKILLAGSDCEFVLQRLTTAGVVEFLFGNGGVVVTTGFHVSSSNCQNARWVCVQHDGRILAGVWDQGCAAGNCRDFAIARYKSNGEPDSSFGTLGKSAPYIVGHDESMSYSAVIDNSNDLVVAGINMDGSGDAKPWALVSYSLGPWLDVATTPGANGQITVAPNPAGDFVHLQSRHIENGNWHLSLFDLTGRTLYSETVVVSNNAFDKSISLMDLPAAMYLMKVDNGSMRMIVRLTKSR